MRGGVMPTLSLKKIKNLEENYQNLKTLIESRQKFETENESDPRYSQYKTDYDFHNIAGHSLIHYATILGDLDKIKELEKNGVSLSKPTGQLNITPLQLAFDYGHKELVEYLSSKVSITNVVRERIDIKEFQEYYDKRIKNEILDPIINNASLLKKPTIPFMPNNNNALYKRSYLNYAAEVGDLDFVKAYFKQNQEQAKNTTKIAIAMKDEKIENPLITAIENKQYDLLTHCLIYVDANVGPSNADYFVSALHVAAANGDWKSAEILFDMTTNLNLNRQDPSGATALYYALANGHEEFAKKLLEKKPKLDMLTFDGKNLFHAVMNCSPEFRDWLENNVPDEIKKLKDMPNIYEQKPADLQQKIASIAQRYIIPGINYYHTLLYRDKEFLSEGYCNGLCFLFQYYHSKGKLPFFRSMLIAVKNWDGSEEALNKKPPEPLDKTFDTLGQLFEEFITWATWYQHTQSLKAKTSLKQSDRKEQFNEKADLHCVIRNHFIEFKDENQLKEYNDILSRLPKNLRIEYGGEEHAVTFAIADKQHLDYFDPNLDVPLTLTSDKITDVMVGIKHNAITGQSGTIISELSAYYFSWDNVDFTHYHYFKDEELPQSKEAADKFTSSSANQLTHLHIAVLTHSIKNVQQLLNNQESRYAHDIFRPS